MDTKSVKRNPVNPTVKEVVEAINLPYDLRKPHKRVVSQDRIVIIQNGQVYEENGAHIGSTQNLLQPGQGAVMVPETGATFPNTPVGKMRMEKYKERNGIGQKPKDGSKVAVKESTLEERKAQRDELKEGKVE